MSITNPGYNYHSHDFGFHLPNARENVGMDGVRHAELPKGLCLELQEILSTVVHSTAHATVFPARVFHICQLIQLSANLLRCPSFLGEVEVSCNTGATCDELRLQALDCRRHLLINLTADTGEPQEDRIEEETDGGVDIADTAKDAIPPQRIECLANVAKDKEDKNDISKTNRPVIIRLAHSSRKQTSDERAIVRRYAGIM